MSDDFKASVNVSRQWDGKRVGQELVDKIKQDDVDPDFILLFSTIHYEGEFQKFLDIVKDEFPDAPLVGGTVAGFMSQQGCYTRGVSAMAVDSEELDIEVGVGYGPKNNPKKCVEEMAEEINGTNNKDNEVLIELLPTAIIPNIPGFGQKNIINSRWIGKFLIKLFPLLNKFNFGYDRADEIIEYLSKIFDEKEIVGGCTMDDNNMLRNYQFYNTDIGNKMLLGINISTNSEIQVENISEFTPLDTSFKVTETSEDRHIIKKINNESAKKKFLRSLGIDIEEESGVYQLYKNAFYYPLGFRKEDVWHAGMIGLIYGQNLIFANKIEGEDVTLLSLSIENMLQKVENKLNEFQKNKTCFMLGFACETFTETLGRNIFDLQEIFNETNIPYLVPFVGGESIFKPDIGSHHLYGSINLISL